LNAVVYFVHQSLLFVKFNATILERVGEGKSAMVVFNIGEVKKVEVPIIKFNT
jgi:hypothetical protein